jgi:hypothetical protein
MTRTWPSLLGIHVAWSVHLVVSYYLAWAACTGDDGWLLALRHLATVVAAAAVAMAIWHEIRASRSAPAEPRTGQPDSVPLSERFNLARVTLILAGIYLLAILMTGAASLFLAPCV